jgi:hypothetical protein
MSQSKLNRRQFAKAATASAMLAATAAESTASAAQPEISTEAQALCEMIRIRFGQHLDEAQLKRVRASVEAGLRRAGRLRKFPVGQDDPAFVFQADVP